MFHHLSKSSDLPAGRSSLTNVKVLENRFAQIKEEYCYELELQTPQPEVEKMFHLYPKCDDDLPAKRSSLTNTKVLERRFAQIKEELKLELPTPQPEVGSKRHLPNGEPQPGIINPSKKVRVERRNDTSDKISALTNQLKKLTQLIENLIQAKSAENINMKRLMVEVKLEMDYFMFLQGSHSSSSSSPFPSFSPSSGSDDGQGNVSTVNENAVGVDLKFVSELRFEDSDAQSEGCSKSPPFCPELSHCQF